MEEGTRRNKLSAVRTLNLAEMLPEGKQFGAEGQHLSMPRWNQSLSSTGSANLDLLRILTSAAPSPYWAYVSQAPRG